MYKSTYEDDHSYIVFNADKQGYNKTRRKGLYEHLLCRECEGIIQKYEDYAKTIIYDKAKPFIEENKIFYKLEKYDYKLFKLFVLSLLWRTSVSRLSECTLSSLGPYEEELRESLLLDVEVSPSKYPVLIYQTYLNDKPANGVFMEIHKGKTVQDNKTIYHFIVDGLLFLVGVGEVKTAAFKNGSCITPNRLLIGYDQLSKLSTFVDLYKRLNEQNKFNVYEKRYNNALK